MPIGLIFHEFILTSNRHSTKPQYNRVISISWKEQNNGTLFVLNDNSEIFMNSNDFSSEIGVDVDLIRFLITQLKGAATWDKKNRFCLKVLFQKHQEHKKLETFLN